DKLETIRKTRVFDSEVTVEEAELIKRRVAIQQERFKAFEERDFQMKAKKIRAVFDHLSIKEIRHALKEANHDEDSVILQLTDPSYLESIRHSILAGKKGKEKREALGKASVLPREYSDDFNNFVCFSLFKIDAITEPNADREEIFAGWSKARVDAYKSIDVCPNRYYYRFNKPGEMQRNGAWTAEEKKLFMQRLDEVGANGQWGIFSIPIPGRVGYQCATFYRTLVKTGKIKDLKYAIHSSGSLQYIGEPDESTFDVNCPKSKKKRGKNDISLAAETNSSTKKGNAQLIEDEALDSEISLGEEAIIKVEQRNAEKEERSHNPNSLKTENNPPEQIFQDPFNPLPEFIDPITLEPVIRPAISPYGHVASYDTWVSCLGGKLCPFTKKPLSRRELVVLTFENINEYR
ncbi:hypothetical protein BDR26DRAFT_809329, partial [Obelidium mucronatum]